MSIKGWVKNWIAKWKAEQAEFERQAEEYPRIRVSLSGGLYVDSDELFRSKKFQRALLECELLRLRIQGEKKAADEN